VITAGQWAARELAYEFSDPSLLEHALTHRSAAAKHNERLEFLGDAVLQLIITDAIYKLKPDTDEGGLSRLRSSLVRKGTLAEIGTELKVAEVLMLGSGEKRTGGHQRSSILADTVEAVIGAVYLDGAYAAAETVVLKLFESRLSSLPDEAALKDPKTRLQEHLQASGGLPPEYEVLDVAGKSHAQTFTIVCRVPEMNLAVQGIGSSRRKAEQQAAEQILQGLGSAADHKE